MATRPESDETPTDDDPRGDAQASTERLPSRSSKKRPVVGGAASRRGRKAVVLPSEAVIDAPSKHTLIMLGALALAIVTMWGASKAACNAHPMQTRKPRDVSTADLARDPKGAALELAQRWAAYDFLPALELAKEPLAEQIKKDQQQCEQDKAGCQKKREAHEQQVLASAVLLSRETDRARARVTTSAGALGQQTFVIELAPEGALWKGVAKLPDSPAAPSAPATAPEPEPTPAPSP
jgi:hypothetical protein